MKSVIFKTSILTCGICFLAFISHAQQKSKPNEYYAGLTGEAHTLGAVFPIDDIESITVTNYHGTHKFTQKELSFIKDQLKKAKYAGGLLVKPGHITMHMQLKTTSVARSGEVYPTKGSIHFDRGVNKLGKQFNGTYYLPLAVNFDNYK